MLFNCRGLFLSIFFCLLMVGCSNENESGTETTGNIDVAHTLAGTDTSAYQQYAEKFKEIVEKRTDGDVTVTIFPNSTMGGEREMAESVELNTLDSAIVSTGPLGNFSRSTYIFDFPFLFEDLEHARNTVDGEIGEEIAESLEGNGMKIMTWAESGFASVTTSGSPIIEPDDYEDLVVRSMENEVQMDAFQALGAQPTPMAFSEIYTALQQGVVDAQANSIGIMVPNRFYEVQEYLSLTEQFYFASPFIMSEEKLEGFTPEIQEVIQDAAHEARDYEREFLDEINVENLETMSDAGLEIIPNEEIDIDAFREKVEPVYDKHYDEFGELLDQIIDVD